MSLEVLQEPEAPLTVFTHKRSLAGVNTYVFLEVTWVVEFLPTLFTLIGFHPQVDQHVFLQGRRPGEAPAALGAVVWLFYRSLALVAGQLCELSEVLLAQGAVRWFFLVSGQVCFQP